MITLVSSPKQQLPKHTVFPHIVSTENIIFWIWKCKGQRSHNINVRKLFNGGNYLRVESIWGNMACNTQKNIIYFVTVLKWAESSVLKVSSDTDEFVYLLFSMDYYFRSVSDFWKRRRISRIFARGSCFMRILLLRFSLCIATFYNFLEIFD